MVNYQNLHGFTINVTPVTFVSYGETSREYKLIQVYDTPVDMLNFLQLLVTENELHQVKPNERFPQPDWGAVLYGLTPESLLGSHRFTKEGSPIICRPDRNVLLGDKKVISEILEEYVKRRN